MDLLLQSFSPFIWIAKFYGVLPFSFQCQNVVISVCGFIYGVALNIVFNSFNLYIFIFFTTNSLECGLTFIFQALNITYLLPGLISFGCFVSIIFKIRSIRKLYEKTLGYSNYLNDRKYRRKVCWLVVCELISFMAINLLYHVQYQIHLMFALDEYSNYAEDNVSNGTKIVEDIITASEPFLHHYFFFMITLINLQFVNLVLFYRSLFQVANDDLKSYLKSNISATGFHFRDEAFTKTKKEMQLIDELGDISKLINYYDQVSNLCRHANVCFNESLLLTSVLTLITVLMSLYFVVREWNTAGVFIFQFGYSVFNLWCILYSCESASCEVS